MRQRIVEPTRACWVALLLAYGAAASLPTPLSADTPGWTPLGPFGAVVTALAIDAPTVPATIYAVIAETELVRSKDVGDEPPREPCLPLAAVLCLNGGRFRVAATWRTAQGSGDAQALPLTPDTGAFWFFSAENLELVVKVLNGCAFNGNYWVFAGGLTNVGVKCLDGNPYVCWGGRPGGHLVGLQKIWERLRQKAGLEDLRLHDIRHHFASTGAAAGMGLPILGSILGHTSPATTARYAHLSDDPKRAAAEQIAGGIAAGLNGQPAGEVIPIKKS